MGWDGEVGMLCRENCLTGGLGFVFARFKVAVSLSRLCVFLYIFFGSSRKKRSCNPKWKLTAVLESPFPISHCPLLYFGGLKARQMLINLAGFQLLY